MQPSEKASFKSSPELVDLVSNATPEQIEQAVEIAGKLMQRRAQREATGQTDLTKKFDPKAMLLTDSEIDQLRQSATELIDFGRMAFPPKA